MTRSLVLALAVLATTSAHAQDRTPALGLDAAYATMFPPLLPHPIATTCATGDDATRVRCHLSALFSPDPVARDHALAIYERSGSVIGRERAYTMDGGFRGTIRIAPALPIGRARRHLAWLSAAVTEYDRFFTALAPHARTPITYRWRAIAFRFFESVRRTTPSAYASPWTIGWNVRGSLHKDARTTRETLFHETFHMNDEAHGNWSPRALREIHETITARCGTSRRCLAPYAPSSTTVRGGTYYAFQPDNGDAVHEYGAELALRYFREQRAVLFREPLPGRAFKCGPPENARAWQLIADEFFGGADVVPACR